MSRRTATVLACSSGLVFLLLLVGTVWLVAQGSGDTDELFGVVLIGYAVVGVLVASRRPDNRVGWLLLAIALAFAVQGFGEVYVVDPAHPGFSAVAWVGGWSWYVWMTLAAVFLPLLFPDGHLLSRRWRVVVWLGLAALVLSIVGAAFKPGDLGLSHPARNPLGVHGSAAEVVAFCAQAGNVLVFIAFVLAALSLVLRFRRARGAQRQQLKWFVLVGVFVGTGLAFAMLQVLFPGGWRDPIGTVGWFTFLFACLIGVPVATGLAILRHRLYDIDVVINRTLVYGLLTVTLGACYLGLVLLFQAVLSPVTADSDLAVAGSTLAVAALFRPARSRIQAVVDRRFYRGRYDASLTLQAFSGRLRGELDLETLDVDLRHVVRDTMHPSHVSLWLREAPR